MVFTRNYMLTNRRIVKYFPSELSKCTELETKERSVHVLLFRS